MEDSEPLASLMTEEEVAALLERWSNAGRWGVDDEFGTLNFVTPEVRLAAIRTVRLGIPVSMG